ncbi:MAG: hypothetical protein K8I02_01495, partial [Candidatus Methylomirabilis sp.]|nr:hypothetical protein [Deltaproteobacteria bacterium]
MISIIFRRFSIGLAAVVLAGLASGAAECDRRIPDPEPGPLGRWVNPFIGTGGLPWTSGMTYPGPTVPFGMVRPGPD